MDQEPLFHERRSHSVLLWGLSHDQGFSAAGVDGMTLHIHPRPRSQHSPLQRRLCGLHAVLLGWPGGVWHFGMVP